MLPTEVACDINLTRSVSNLTVSAQRVLYTR
jgi:hypothetical protein